MVFMGTEVMRNPAREAFISNSDSISYPAVSNSTARRTSLLISLNPDWLSLIF
jgi:hypothetical protein